MKKRELIAENEVLSKQVELAKKQLIQLESRNGKKQIPIPGETTIVAETNPAKSTEPIETQSSKPAKEKKEKPKKEKAPAAAAEPEGPIDVGRLDFRVGRIVEIQKHPDADSLYMEKIDVGEPKPRTIISGLVKFVPIEEMQNRLVVVLCNLKPAKMRGILSEGMVMCASTTDKVEVLSPPASAQPGDSVHCEGFPRNPDAQLNPKKKIFETCAPDLLTNDQFVACYKGVALHIPGKGNIVSATLKNVNVK